MSLYAINFSVSTNEDWLDTIALVENEGEVDEEAYDLSGSTFLMHVRERIEDLATVLVLSTDNGRLIIEPAPEDAGKLTIFVPQATVDDIDPGVYVHDLVWTLADGREVNLASGTLTVALGVTR